MEDGAWAVDSNLRVCQWFGEEDCGCRSLRLLCRNIGCIDYRVDYSLPRTDLICPVATAAGVIVLREEFAGLTAATVVLS